MKTLTLALISGLMLAGAARAEVTDTSPAGFETRTVEIINAPPAKVRAALVDIGAWWSGTHSYSGDARNLSLDLTTGCFCERLKDGFVRHMTVVYVDANVLRLEGALGPLQGTGAIGHLAFSLKPAADGKTSLTVGFDVGGYARGGLAETWAKPVDGVLALQAARLKAYAETGKPD